MIVTVRNLQYPDEEIRGEWVGAEGVDDAISGILVIDDAVLHVLHEVSRAHWEIVKTEGD